MTKPFSATRYFEQDLLSIRGVFEHDDFGFLWAYPGVRLPRQVFGYDESSRRFNGLADAALMDSNPAIFLRITL